MSMDGQTPSTDTHIVLEDGLDFVRMDPNSAVGLGSSLDCMNDVTHEHCFNVAVVSDSSNNLIIPKVMDNEVVNRVRIPWIEVTSQVWPRRLRWHDQYWLLRQHLGGIPWNVDVNISSVGDKV